MKTSFGLRIVALAVMVFDGMALLTACGGADAPAKSNADLLKDAVANMKVAKTYHIEADITSSGQHVTLSGDMDVVGKNLKLSMNAAGQAMDVVKVGADTYSSLDGGKTYTKAGAAAVPDLSSFTSMWDSIKPEDVDKAKDGLKDGTPPTEKIGDADTKHITGNGKDLSQLMATSDPNAQDSTIDFWITTDAKPTIRQMKFSGKDAKGSETSGTFKWSNIDGPMNITAPPVSLLPPVVAYAMR